MMLLGFVPHPNLRASVEETGALLAALLRCIRLTAGLGNCLADALCNAGFKI